MKKAVYGLIVTLLLTNMLALTFRIQQVRASATIYIRADGSINPPSALISTFDNVTYALTGNITSDGDGIVVERDNIVVDGAEYKIQGTGSGTGIMLSGRSNVTIKNTEITIFYYGISLGSSPSNSISGNNITNNEEGILLVNSPNNKIYHNNLINNPSQALSDWSTNVWDDGYPSGGNYWSDYNGTDANHDGIGDTSYVINASNTDHYTLMAPYAIPEFPLVTILPFLMALTMLTVITKTKVTRGKN